jgi:MarR family transcriptional regulator, organic hydroperoxide resistance regulator
VSVLDFMKHLWAVDHGLQSTSKRMESTLGVTGPQRFVVRLIGRNPAISAGKLAEELHLHPSTLTGILQRLEARGAITRTPDPEDGRRVLLSLTPQGRELDALRSGTVEASVRKALGKLPREKVEAAQEVLAMLAAELRELK